MGSNVGLIQNMANVAAGVSHIAEMYRGGAPAISMGEIEEALYDMAVSGVELLALVDGYPLPYVVLRAETGQDGGAKTAALHIAFDSIEEQKRFKNTLKNAQEFTGLCAVQEKGLIHLKVGDVLLLADGKQVEYKGKEDRDHAFLKVEYWGKDGAPGWYPVSLAVSDLVGAKLIARNDEPLGVRAWEKAE